MKTKEEKKSEHSLRCGCVASMYKKREGVERKKNKNMKMREVKQSDS